MASEQVIAWTAEGVQLERMGNRDAIAAPQGVFPTDKTERWVAITVVDDEQWRTLVDLTGLERWAADPDLRTLAGRRAQADRIEAELAGWTAGHDRAELVGRLLAAGIPAAEIRDSRFIHDHPQLAARGWYQPFDLPWRGVIPLPQLPVRPTSGAWAHRHRPPTLGEHNTEVLGGELGLDPEQLAALTADRVIGTAPEGAT